MQARSVADDLNKSMLQGNVVEVTRMRQQGWNGWPHGVDVHVDSQLTEAQPRYPMAA